ncbi:hypothetical protein [Synechococcus sp. UW140]|uniref:hypothetical protein n=1 Tax=Synechococcus sp. UW140 TaxID=368503 RepID=UPI0031378CA8
MSNNDIVFLVDHYYYADSLHWLISACLEAGYSVRIISPLPIFNYLLQEYFAHHPSSHALYHDNATYKIKARNVFEALAREILTPPSFSLYYNQIYQRRFPLSFLISKTISKILAPFTIQNSNLLISKARNIFARPPIKRQLVISMTLSPSLCIVSDSCRLVLVEESWDHFSKYPFGYLPYMYLSWSGFTKELVLKYQKLSNVICASPWKLAYILQSNLNKQEKKSHSLKILYPATFSCNSSGSLMEQEDSLVSTINNSLRVAIGDYTMYLKPKPNGSSNDFTKASLLDNCIVLGENSFQELDNKNYKLTSSYNSYRLQLLENVDIVISFATTFAIECAHLFLPVLLIDPLDVPYPLRRSVFSRDHLVNLYTSFDIADIPLYKPSSLRQVDELYDIGSRISEHLRSLFPIQDPSSLSTDIVSSRISQ